MGTKEDGLRVIQAQEKNIKYCISASVELNSFANGFPFRFTSQTIALLFE